MNDIPAIPTKYKAIQFRSQLEARWACFFDKVGLPWAYEPFPLKGYIPDFILPLEDTPQLIEIKPDVRISDLERHIGKIAVSGWNGEVAICGAMLHHGRDWNCAPTIGAHFELQDEMPWVYGVLVLGRCNECGRTTVIDGHQDFRCRRCGTNDGGNHFTNLLGTDLAWAEAGNEVRWTP